MPRVRASIELPYHLKLEDGSYLTGHQGRELEVHQSSPLGDVASTIGPLLVGPVSGRPLPSDQPYRTIVSLMETISDTEDREEQFHSNRRLADRLLLHTNRLLRSYRAFTRDATITELSRAEASPFRFVVLTDGADPISWESELVYRSTPPEALVQPPEMITEHIRELMASGREPEVADLFLLDAELAIHEGRFREAVLFCWSTIDATFNRKYDRLVEAKLAGEWKEGRDFFTGLDFRMRNKMSAGLFLLTGRSFFREPGDFWERLSKSYSRRNGIIHRGDGADEVDARMALEVARRVVEIMGEL
jgi:hypothetical protein